ncbi:hypothetical protein L6R52_07465 [Myxococcota bacterium]|nr:hypothetical protein [Myxococcota bacterium]
MNREHLSTLLTRLGGFFGLAYFLAFAVKPAFIYGGFLGVIVSSALHGGPVGGDLSTRLLSAAGMLLGVVATGALLVAFGYLAGRLVAVAAAPLVKRFEESAELATHV